MLRSYGLLVAWQASRLKGFLPLAIVVQALFAFGIVVGFPLLFPEIDRLTILYLATGAFTITLVTIGLVALPQVVSQAKLEGILEYMRSLPVPRMTYLLADLTVWLAIVLPGVVFAVVVGAWSFSLDLAVSPTSRPSCCWAPGARWPWDSAGSRCAVRAEAPWRPCAPCGAPGAPRVPRKGHHSERPGAVSA